MTPQAARELRQHVEAIRRAEAELERLVFDLRARGETWEAIGTALGVSRQAAQQRFRRPA